MVTAQVLRAMQAANQGGQMLRQGPNIVSPGSLLARWRIFNHACTVDGSPCNDPADAPDLPGGSLQTEPTPGGSPGPREAEAQTQRRPRPWGEEVHSADSANSARCAC